VSSRRFLSTSSSSSSTPELWVEAGDDVVVTGRVVARTRTGRKLDAPYAHVFSFRDGKVCRNDNFHDTALWVAALS
jgi:uncharacterized protein